MLDRNDVFVEVSHYGWGNPIVRATHLPTGIVVSSKKSPVVDVTFEFVIEELERLVDETA